MIIVDTSVWIEFFRKNEPIHSGLEDKLNRSEVIGIECVFGELLQGCVRENEIETIKVYWKNLPKIDESDVWIEAGEYSGRNNLISKGIGLIDSVIFLLAIRAKSQIWTLDKKLLKLLDKKIVFRL